MTPRYAHHPQGRRRPPRRAHSACPGAARPPGGAWQRQPPRLMGGVGARGVGGAPHSPGASPRRHGRHRGGPRASPQLRRGSPLGERRQAITRERWGAGRGLTQPPSIWRGQARATGRRGWASPGERQRQEQAPPWPARQPALAVCCSRRTRGGCGPCWLTSVAPRADALRRGVVCRITFRFQTHKISRISTIWDAKTGTL
jgi:hypothetical protein